MAGPASRPGDGGIRNSIQGAHIVAQNVPYPQLSQMIINQSNEAFTSGSEHALVIAAIIMAVSAVVTLFILPQRVRAPKEESRSIHETEGQEVTSEVTEPDEPLR